MITVHYVGRKRQKADQFARRLARRNGELKPVQGSGVQITQVAPAAPEPEYLGEAA